MRWRPLFLLALFGLLPAGTVSAAAETYPSRAVKVIVGYSAGGTTDVTARLLAQALSEKTHGSFIIENRTGAGGVIGADAVAKSPADGYTLLYAASPELSLARITKKSVPFDAQKDFVPINFVGSVPFVLVANKDLPANNLAELIDYAKKNPTSISFSSFGSGTSNHLAGELLNLRAGIKMQHIPYRGSAPSLTDLMGGQVHVTFDTITSVMPLLEAGQIKALAVATPQRLKALPAVPTMSESGQPGFTGGTWFALMAPSGTPPAIVAELSSLTSSVLASPDLQKSLEAQGIVVQNQNAEAFNKFLGEEIDKWRKVVEQIGLVPQ